MLTPEINEILRPYYGLIFPVILIALGVWLLVRGALRGRRARPAAAVPAGLPAVSEPSPRRTRSRVGVLGRGGGAGRFSP